MMMNVAPLFCSTVNVFGLEVYPRVNGTVRHVEKIEERTAKSNIFNIIIPYTTKHSRGKTFAVRTKLDIRRENFRGRSFL